MSPLLQERQHETVSHSHKLPVSTRELKQADLQSSYIVPQQSGAYHKTEMESQQQATHAHVYTFFTNGSGGYRPLNLINLHERLPRVYGILR